MRREGLSTGSRFECLLNTWSEPPLPQQPPSVTKLLRNTPESVISTWKVYFNLSNEGQREMTEQNFVFVLDVIHPVLGQLLVGTTPTSPAANLYRSDTDSRT